MNARLLRTCSAGGGHHLISEWTSLVGGQYFCPRHLNDLFSGFDPKYRDQVRFVRSTDTSTYVVLGRDQNLVTVRLLGFPEGRIWWTTVSELYPVGTSPRFKRGCGYEDYPARPKEDSEHLALLRFSHRDVT